MFNSSKEKITNFSRFFLDPSNSTHRQYEALRAYFVEGKPSAEIAAWFGYTPGSFRLLCHQFRKNPDRQFFLSPGKGPHRAPKRDNLRERVIALRKQNLSIYDIAKAVENMGQKVSPVTVSMILKEEGFARLPRRQDDERPAGVRPVPAEVADVRHLDLAPRRFRTKFGGLFLFLPFLTDIPFDQIVEEAGFPGSRMIPAGNAMRSLLGLKLWGNARHSHVMSYVFDEGLALFAGLNTIPKRAYLTEYSCRIDPSCYPRIMQFWFDAARKLGLEQGASFDLDFHTIPFHGEDALVEKHYVSKRSRRQKGILAFLVRDSDNNVFCYVNAQLRKEQRNDEILEFVEFWKQRTGRFPEELIFDSQLTTYPNLNKLNKMNIKFITIRRRHAKLLEEINREPASAWRRIELKGIAREYRTPKILDRETALNEYDEPLRQLTVIDLGHEKPTLLMTNWLRQSPSKLIGRYAQRMLIENSIADSVDFFHMDALSSAVAMKVNCDLILTLMASGLYRLFGAKVGNGYKTAKSSHIFRDLIDATAQITISNNEILVRFHKRAHNPLLISAGFANMNIQIPWLGMKRIKFQIG